MTGVTPINEVIDLAEFGNNPYNITITPQPVMGIPQGGMPPMGSSGGSYGITTPHVHTGGGVNCPSVMLHINSCPLCNKLYNPDRTLYILIIIILSIVSIILLKKSMDR